jgi:hypothetical protein
VDVVAAKPNNDKSTNSYSKMPIVALQRWASS